MVKNSSMRIDILDKESFLHELNDVRHNDMIDAMAYMIAGQELKLRESYILLYVKKKPKWCPEFIYHWFVKKFIVIAEFKKP